MRSEFILVLTMALYANVKCADSSGFNYASLPTDIKQILKQRAIQQSNKQILMLQDQLQSQNENLEYLQHEVSILFEASEINKNQIKALREEMEQLKSNQKPQQTTSNEVEQQELEIEEPSKPKVDSDLQWKSWSLNETIPQNAVEAGYDLDKAPIFVGRSYVNGSHIIAKVIPDRPAAYYSFEGLEYSVDNCEILTGSGFSWARTYHGNLPQNAVSSGKWINDVPHFIGRANHNSEEHGFSRVPGTIHGERRILYIPFRGREREHSVYEVLVQNKEALERKATIYTTWDSEWVSIDD